MALSTFHQPPAYFLFKWFYDSGDILVDLFFVISGFIFVYVYEQEIKEKRITAKEFFLKRIFRLYPLHLITLLVVAVGQYLYFLLTQTNFIYEQNDLFHFILNLELIQYGWLVNATSFNGPSWTLALEFISYISFFVVVAYFSKIKPIYLYGVLTLIGALLGILNFQYPLLNFQVGRGLSGFFVGAIISHVHQLINKMKKETKEGYLILSSLLSLLGIYFISQYRMNFLYPLLVFPTVIVFSLNIRRVRRFFSLKPLVILGSISYSIYLWHFPLQLIIVTLLASTNSSIDYRNPGFLILYSFVTFAVSAVSYYFFEQQLYRKLKNKFL